MKAGFTVEGLRSVRLYAEDNVPPASWPVCYDKPENLYADLPADARAHGIAHWDDIYHADLLAFARYRWITEYADWPGYAQQRKELQSILLANRVLSLFHAIGNWPAMMSRERMPDEGPAAPIASAVEPAPVQAAAPAQTPEMASAPAEPLVGNPKSEWTAERLAKRYAELKADGNPAPMKTLAQIANMPIRTIQRLLAKNKKSSNSTFRKIANNWAGKVTRHTLE